MTLRKFGPKTQAAYVRAVKNLARFLGRSPDVANAEDLRRFQLDIAQRSVSRTTINATISGLRFFFEVTLERPEVMTKMKPVPVERKLPVILSVEELGVLLRHAPSLKARAVLSVAYGAGLRASEICRLRIPDIDPDRKLLRIEQAKGRKDRYALLSPAMLTIMRRWWCEGRRRGKMLPNGWLFRGIIPVNPLSIRQPNRYVHEAAEHAARDSGVAGSGLESGVPEQDLDEAYIDTALEQLGGEGMTGFPQFHRRAWIELAPSLCRTPSNQSAGSRWTYPGGTSCPRF